MSGHSKWAQIKHKKGAADAKKGRLFSKLAQGISLAAREKGSSHSTNAALRAAIEKAQAANMPKENIERAVTRGMGAEGAALESVLYEAYGPGGVALIIEGITENNNRTFAEVRKILQEYDAKMAPGGVKWIFEKTAGEWCAKTTVPVDAVVEKKVNKLKEALEEHADIQGVYINMQRE